MGVSLFFVLFIAGVLTVLLPCILPLLPIAVGAGVAGRHPLRPVLLALGMVTGFVGITFALYVLLSSFIVAANAIQIGTEEVLYLFGIAFLVERRLPLLILAALGGLFFLPLGPVAVFIAAAVSAGVMHVGTGVAGRVQQAGGSAQQAARGAFGEQSLLTAFVLGLTMGLVWVPCAGPALGFALTLVRTQPGIQAFAALTTYAVGAALPVLLLGYGGQWAAERVKGLKRFTGAAKHVAGGIFVATSLLLTTGLLMDLQTWLVNNTAYGTFGTALEERLFPMPSAAVFTAASASSASSAASGLPRIARAPELTGLQQWFNSDPLTMAGLKGKVVLVDFWTYSCINCIRTLPYLRGYWEKYREAPFVLIGVHTPEFVFEKDPKNVRQAIDKYDLQYPIVQDNDFATWDAFANRYWPAKYLIDAEGYVRYTHFGEGAYDETDEAIASLLREIDVTVDGATAQDPSVVRRVTSPETYLHSRSWSALGNGPLLPTSARRIYEAPAAMELHKYYLDGEWQLQEDERMVLRSDSGEIRMKWLGGEINLVLGLEGDAAPVKGEVWMDGVKVKDITVTDHDLYELFKGAYGEHELVLELSGAGLAGYAFTFGS